VDWERPYPSDLTDAQWELIEVMLRTGVSTAVPRMTHVEIEITAELVRDLVRDQHPDLADRLVRLGAWMGQPTVAAR
jgi:transposase